MRDGDRLDPPWNRAKKAAVGLPHCRRLPLPRTYGRPLGSPKGCFHPWCSRWTIPLATCTVAQCACTSGNESRRDGDGDATGRRHRFVPWVRDLTRSVGPVRPLRWILSGRCAQVSTVQTLDYSITKMDYIGDPSPWSNKQWRKSTKSKID
jgi:hypothetical protein